MSDLIERLRHADAHSQQRVLGSRIFSEAADEIERLRQAATDFMLLFVQESGDERTLSVEDIDHQELAQAYERLSVAIASTGGDHG